MTPDEAIALVQKYGKDAQVRVDGYSTWQDAACVLAGEFERLANDLKLSRGVVKDVFDDMECLPNCDSYGHEDECPDVNPMAAFRKLRQERDELRRRVAELTNPKLTNCWKCSDTYEIKLGECPHCGAANANVNWELAKDQIQIEGGA